MSKTVMTNYVNKSPGPVFPFGSIKVDCPDVEEGSNWTNDIRKHISFVPRK